MGKQQPCGWYRKDGFSWGGHGLTFWQPCSVRALHSKWYCIHEPKFIVVEYFDFTVFSVHFVLCHIIIQYYIEKRNRKGVPHRFVKERRERKVRFSIKLKSLPLILFKILQCIIPLQLVATLWSRHWNKETLTNPLLRFVSWMKAATLQPSWLRRIQQSEQLQELTQLRKE